MQAIRLALPAKDSAKAFAQFMSSASRSRPQDAAKAQEAEKAEKAKR